MKVFISTTTFAEYSKESLSLLRKKGMAYTLNPHRRRLKQNEIDAILRKDSYVGLIAGTESLTKKVLENAKSLKVISRAGVGLDNIDLDAARRLNIKIYNTAYVLIDSVAELTIALILCCLRKITSVDRNMHSKIWKKQMGSLFKGKTLGIIGFGKIGKRVAQLAKAFGAKMIFYDTRVIKSVIAKQVSLDTLFRESDIISIHTSAKEQLISEKDISRMKKSVILVNTSRGSVVDENSLYKGLRSGKIGFAALDVYRKEPYLGKLLNLDNVIFTPHVGSYAKEARIEMEKKAVENLIEGLKERDLL